MCSHVSTHTSAGGAEFLQRYGSGLVQILCGFLGNVKERGMLALMPVMDLVIQVCPGIWAQSGRQTYPGIQGCQGHKHGDLWLSGGQAAWAVSARWLVPLSERPAFGCV